MADEASDIDSHNVSDLEEREEYGDVASQGNQSEVAEREFDHDNSQDNEEEEEGEDLMANFSEDYRAMPEIDRYEEEGLDDDATGQDVTFEEAQAIRMRAEAEMDRRDDREGGGTRRRRLIGALEDSIDEEDRRPTRRRRMDRAQAGYVDGEEDLPTLGVDLESLKGNPHHFLAQEPVQKEIQRQFSQFLKTFNDGIYIDSLREMILEDKQSLEVSSEDIAGALPLIWFWIVEHPRILLDLLHKAANQLAKEQYPELFEDAEEKSHDIYVRFGQLSMQENLRDIRHVHLNKLISVRGVVTRRTGVFPQLQMVKYDCKCGYVLGPFYQNTEHELKLLSCPVCQTKSGFEVNTTQTIYRNFQKLTLQETPGTVPAGRLPRHKEVILLHNLIDCARPGEEIQVVGIYSNSYDAALNVKNGFPVFSTVIEANNVSNTKSGFLAYNLTDEDVAELRQLGGQPDIGRRIAKSIAPSIYAHSNIKLGIALALFGGQEKHSSGHHRLRGDINMLLLGDPGTAKSQFLKYVQGVAQRAVYTTGKGASAVGLTAAVQKDVVTKEWTLEGGALVLADRGVCLIDEFDKMNDQDRVSIHEAMEQQSISISKAGIVTSLQARCSVLAAANPTQGRYDRTRTFAENVELSDPILSRFDILCVVEDVVDPINDERLAEFVVSSHTKAHPDHQADQAEPQAVSEDILPQEVLKKYITYAKQRIHPILTSANESKISEVYAELREQSALNHGMPIAVRHLESIIRMSEAHARMHLRDYVSDDDVDKAISVMLESFISTQKNNVQRVLKKRFKRFMTHSRDANDLLLVELQELIRGQLRAYNAGLGAQDGLLRVQGRFLRRRAEEYRINDVRPFLDSQAFANAGFTYLPTSDVITFPA